MDAVVDDYDGSITVYYEQPNQSLPPVSFPFVNGGENGRNEEEEEEEWLSDLPVDYLDPNEDEPYSSQDEFSRETLSLSNLASGFRLENYQPDEGAWAVKNDDLYEAPIDYQPRVKPAFKVKSNLDGQTEQSVTERIMSIVHRFIGEDFYALLTEETNRYYDQEHHRYEDRNEKRVRWTDVTIKEMKTFIGLLVLMPCVKKHSMAAYWKSDSAIDTPHFRQYMSRDRFFEIWKYWHFNDNSNQDMLRLIRDRRCKVRPVLSHFHRKFNDEYDAGREICLREEIFSWAGRRRFTFRHNPERVGLLGMVLRTLADCQSGYVMNVEFEDLLRSLTADKWDDILKPFEGRHHHLYVNSCYTSVWQARQLLAKQIHVCGPIPKPRGAPQKLLELERNLRRNEHTFVRQGEVLVHSWSSPTGRLTRMISTIHPAKLKGPQKVADLRMRKPDMPTSMVDYQYYTTGSDLHEQFIKDYDFLGRIRRFSKRVVLFMIRVALHNSFIRFKQLFSGHSYVNFHRFMGVVANEMCRAGQVLPPPPTPEPGAINQFYFGPPNQVWIHLIAPIEGTVTKKAPTLQCYQCRLEKRRRKESRYYCLYCRVPLHIGCYAKFHGIKPDQVSQATLEQIREKVSELRAEAKAARTQAATVAGSSSSILRNKRAKPINLLASSRDEEGPPRPRRVRRPPLKFFSK